MRRTLIFALVLTGVFLLGVTDVLLHETGPCDEHQWSSCHFPVELVPLP